MKIYRLHIVMMIVALCLTSGLVFAQEATLEPTATVTLPSEMGIALVPCTTGAIGPCDLIATKAEDIVGVWKQYLIGPVFNAPGGMAYIRFNADGTFNLADSIENSANPETSYASGTFSFEGQVVTYGAVVGAPAPCDTPPQYQLRVLKYGDQPVALRYVAISDPCVDRLRDVSQALVWVAPSE
jgi:hypothetical protein